MIEISPSSLFASKISLQLKENLSSSPKFIKNSIVQGKVISTTSANDTLLLINGEKVTARTRLPLKEGAILLLKVEQADPVPILKLVGPSIAASNTVNVSLILAAMQENLWKTILENIPLGGVSKQEGQLFRELLQDLSTKLFENRDPDLLKNFISKSGLTWENKLKEICVQKQIGKDSINRIIAEDLKGLGSRLLSLNAEKEAVLDRFIATLKNIQLLNQPGLEQDRKIFLPMPIQFPNGLFTVGQLLIHFYQEKKDEQGNMKKDRSFYKISFLLELSNLGPLRADLTIVDKSIDGKFLFSKKESKLLIEKNLPLLVDNLNDRGFSIRRMECCLKRPEVVKQSLIKEIIQPEGSTVSLVA